MNINKILNRTISTKKYIFFALLEFFGIGRSISKKILQKLKINFNLKFSNLSDNEVNNLKKYLLNLSRFKIFDKNIKKNN